MSKLKSNLRYRIATKLLKMSSERHYIFENRFHILNMLILKWPISIRSQKNSRTLKIQDQDLSDHTLVITRPSRFEKYQYGICERLANLRDEYFLNKMNFKQDDIFIDVGANIGEVSLAALDLNENLHIHAVEPDATEFEALSENLPQNATLHPSALWDSITTLTFYENNETGDSSIFPHKGNLKQVSIKTDTLDNIYQKHHPNGTRIRLLKLEAEGAEPEILRGASLLIQNTQSIVVDVGPERGLKKENTLAPVANLLYAAGFYIHDFHSYRNVLWFERNTDVEAKR